MPPQGEGPHPASCQLDGAVRCQVGGPQQEEPLLYAGNSKQSTAGPASDLEVCWWLPRNMMGPAGSSGHTRTFTPTQLIQLGTSPVSSCQHLCAGQQLHSRFEASRRPAVCHLQASIEHSLPPFQWLLLVYTSPVAPVVRPLPYVGGACCSPAGGRRAQRRRCAARWW
jgi:hypothetical protein